MAKKQPTTQTQDTPPAPAQQASEGDLLALVIEAFKRIEAGQDKIIAQNGALAEHIAFALAEVRSNKLAKKPNKKVVKLKRRQRWARRFKKK